MTATDDAVAALDDLIASRLEPVTPFMALVSDYSDGMVRIQRLTDDAPDTQGYARIGGFNIEVGNIKVGDVVTCLPVAGGIPVVVGRVEVAAGIFPYAAGTDYGDMEDSSTGIIAAAALAQASGRWLTLAGTFRVDAKFTIAANADLRLATFLCNSTAFTPVVVGSDVDGVAVNNIEVYLPTIINTAHVVGSGWSGSSSGAEVSNLTSSTVHVKKIEGFVNGLKMSAHDGANMANHIYIRELKNNRRNLRIEPADTTGYVNNSTFYEGRLWYNSGEGVEVAGTRQISITYPAGGKSPNNHKFYNQIVEGDTPEFHLACTGDNNVFFGLRWETVTVDPKVAWTQNSSSEFASKNLIFLGKYAGDIVETTSANSSGNKIITIDDLGGGGGGGSGDVVGPSSSVASEVALFDGTSGKLLKRATGTGIAKLTSGVLGTAAASDLPSGIDAAKIGGGTVSNTEFGFLDGVGSAIQTQLNGKAATSHTHTASDVTNFDTQVRTSRLDQMAAPTASVSLNSQKITNLLDPTNAQDAASKAYVDAIASGLDLKASVRVASTGNVTISSPGASIDGVSLSAGNRVLLKDQTTGSQNGIYLWNGAAVAMTRATDADSSAEVTSGMFVFVEEGSANADQGFALTTNNPITLGTTALVFTQISGAGQITAGVGLQKSGNQLSIDSTVATLAGSQTLTNKTLTAPSISSPTGLVKGDVGLGNVDNTSDATKNAAAATLSNKTLTTPTISDLTNMQHDHSAANKGGTLAASAYPTMVGDSGSGGTQGAVPAPAAGDAAANKFLNADGTWKTAPGAGGGSGDVVGPASSVASEIVLFDGTTGKLVKRATGSGIVKATSGVYSTVTAPSGDIVGTSDSQTLTNKTLGSFTATGDSTLGDGDGDVTIIQGHLRHKSAAPSITAGVALGTGGSMGASIVGTDQAGEITITAGSTGRTTGLAATISFATARPNSNYAIKLTPATQGASSNAVQWITNNNTNSFTISFNVAPTATTYGWFYAILEWTN